MPVNRLGTEELILWVKERRQRERQSREVRRTERKARGGAFRRIAEIVVLIAAVIDPVSAADDRLSTEHSRRPCHAQTWPQILRVRIVIGRPLRTESTATLYVDYRRTIQDLVRNRVVFIPEPQVQRQVWVHFELVLKVVLVKSAAISNHP